MLYVDIPKILFLEKKKTIIFFLHTKAANVCPTEPNAIR
jgi:hypothetical protein